MIDPSKITKFNRSDSELEEFLLFCVLVANKPAKITAKKLDNLLKSINSQGSPLNRIKFLIKNHKLSSHLKQHKTGQYSRIIKCLNYLVLNNLNLKDCSVEDLEKVPGIGPKTARFFILHSRPKQQIAVLDTHILKYLRENGYSAPKQTPPSKRYKELEKAFIREAKKANKDLASFDLELWNHYHDRA